MPTFHLSYKDLATGQKVERYFTGSHEDLDKRLNDINAPYIQVRETRMSTPRKVGSV